MNDSMTAGDGRFTRAWQGRRDHRPLVVDRDDDAVTIDVLRVAVRRDDDRDLLFRLAPEGLLEAQHAGCDHRAECAMASAGDLDDVDVLVPERRLLRLVEGLVEVLVGGGIRIVAITALGRHRDDATARAV